VAIPLILGLLQQAARHAGIYTAKMDWPQLGGWVFSLSNLFAFTLIIWWNASVVRRADAERQRAEEELRRLNRDLEDGVSRRTARCKRSRKNSEPRG